MNPMFTTWLKLESGEWILTGDFEDMARAEEFAAEHGYVALEAPQGMLVVNPVASPGASALLEEKLSTASA